MSPRVSVLMGVYNEEKYLRESIDCILNQTFSDFEFIIINDASTDQSRDIICSYKDSRIHLLDNEKNMGLTFSLNRGLNMAQGIYIARQDADDISMPQRFEKQLKVGDENPRVGLVATDYRHFSDAKGRSPAVQQSSDPLILKWQMLFSNRIGHPTVLFKKEMIDEAGGYNEDFPRGQDYELWSRILDKWEVAILPEVLCLRRSDAAPPAFIYRANQSRTPACQISVNNIRKITHGELKEGQCEFLHYLLGAGQLPAETGAIEKNINSLNCVMDHFMEKHKATHIKKKILKVTIQRLLVFLSPHYKMRSWGSLYCYLLSLDCFLTFQLTLNKIFNKINRLIFNEKEIDHGLGK